MKILVTGGAGFIGSNLVDYLVYCGEDVIVVDDLSTGKLSNLSSSMNNITFYEQQLEKFKFSSCPNIDAIIHLAAQPSVPLSISNFKESSSTNILGTICVVDYCNSNKIPLVYASSSALYGGLEFGDDESSQTDLLSPYATDKYAMELYAKTSYKLYQLSSVSLRFFNVYGPRQDPGSPYSGVISIFIDRLLKNDTIIVNGGHQTRDFIYVSDVVKFIYRALMIAKNNVICEQVNILTGGTISIDSLADMLMSQVGYNVDKIYRDLSIGDPERSNGSVEKMINLLDADILSLTQLDTGLKQTIEFIRKDGRV